VAVKRDITRELSMEAQLRQAQKMDAVGRLAGGVAHDFNNKLQTILGYTDLLLSDASHDGPDHEMLSEIRNAAERSAALTRQLLAFARKQTISPQVLDLNETVGGMLKMLRRLIGENIELHWQPGTGLDAVLIDPAQIDQVLANLVVNARDAIEGVGRIVIETGLYELDGDSTFAAAGRSAGRYIVLSVSDDGCGMEAETLERIFEPFFTTKPREKGTGLGLATVYGIVQQNGGFADVSSKPGKGTSFRIFLPARTADDARRAEPDELPEEIGGPETVLVVEDDPAILLLSRRILEQLGYRVHCAESPEKAKETVRGLDRPVDLLLTDVIMPRMSGRDLWDELRGLQPSMKCLFMSGYTADVIAHRGVLDEGISFIQKPFSARGLGAKVREALGTDEDER
jgi:nitrogen-specific signal transduction histidine kinase/ActR/RegA family two-component response regulator